VKEKTFKREVACAALLFLFALAAYSAFTIAKVGTPQGSGPLLIQLVTVLTPPTFLFAGLAFGLDWRSKQGGAL